MGSPRIVHVAVAVIRDTAGRVLVAQRLPHQHLAGLWEFPGGKLEAGETLAEGMAREIREELGIDTGALAPLMRIAHEYPEKTVLLDVWRVIDWQGEPHGAEGQPLRWLHPRDMNEAEFPPADVPIIAALRLPSRYVISPDLDSVDACEHFVACCTGIAAELVQVRLKSQPALAARLVADLRAALPSARILLNSDTLAGLPEVVRPAVDGIHLTAQALREASRAGKRPTGMVAASCHDARELALAHELALDFVTLSPVQLTASHPGVAALGWRRFADLAAGAGVPVYALGGLSPRDFPVAEAHGAIGIAGISGIFDQ